MARAVDLSLREGGGLRLDLPDAVGEGAFVFALPHSGADAFRALVGELARAGGAPVVDLDAALEAHGARAEDLAPEAVAALRGYVVLTRGAALWNLAAPMRRIILLRDPRDVAVTAFLEPDRLGAPTLADYLAGPEFGAIIDAYRVFLAGVRRRDDLWLRYEHALDGWREIAADLAAFLGLELAPRRTREIADAAPAPGSGWRDSRHREMALYALIALNGAPERVEAKLGFALEALGCPDTPALWCAERAGPIESSLRPLGARAPEPDEPPPPHVSQPDPVLYHRLRPNARREREVGGRRILLETDAFGRRLVVGQPETAQKTVAIYGCSFTFGTTSPAEETFCSRLQAMLPKWRIENHGVAGYSQSRNLIALERETRFNPAEIVGFTWIRDHLRRNAADIGWVQATSAGMLEGTDGKARVAVIPRAALNAEGELSLTAIRYPRDDLGGVDVEEFEPSPFYLDQVCFKLFERADKLVKGYGGRFFVVDLHGGMSPALTRMLKAANIPLVKTLFRDPKYFVTPTDPHPNALAHQVYAEKIYEHLATLA